MTEEQQTNEKSSHEIKLAPKWRLTSLDALRGFTMFWIIGSGAFYDSLKTIAEGGGEEIQDFAVLAKAGFAGFLANQFEHRSWEGFVFYDLIFPTFIFIIGVSIVFSLNKMRDHENKAAIYKRIVKRFVILFLLGVFYDKGVEELFHYTKGGAVEYGHFHEDILCGVLQRLAWCYLFTSLLFMNLRLKGLIAVFVSIMIGYWALCSFVKAPDEAEYSLEKNHNISHWIDKQIPPYHSTDPEGWFSTIPAVSSCLLGVFTAFLIRNKSVTEQKKVLYMLGTGVLMVIAGYLWSYQFPIIKRLWTSTYVLVAGGYSLILLAVFYQIIDIWRIQKWSKPFIWIGANPLTIYMATNIIDFDELAGRFVGGPIKEALGLYGPLINTFVSVGLCLWLVRFLYKKQIFLRV